MRLESLLALDDRAVLLFSPQKLHKVFAADELQKLHVIKFCNLFRPENVINRCLAFYFWYNIGVNRSDVKRK